LPFFWQAGWVASWLCARGVTGLVGEGDQLPLESPEQVRRRLALIGGLFGAMVFGWLLARLGDVYRQCEPRRPRVARLVAELLLLLGGVGLAVGALAWCGPRSASYEVPNVYRQVGAAALGCGPVCLGVGWVLFRRSARPANQAGPVAAADRPRD